MWLALVCRVMKGTLSKLQARQWLWKHTVGNHWRWWLWAYHQWMASSTIRANGVYLCPPSCCCTGVWHHIKLIHDQHICCQYQHFCMFSSPFFGTVPVHCTSVYRHKNAPMISILVCNWDSFSTINYVTSNSVQMLREEWILWSYCFYPLNASWCGY